MAIIGLQNESGKSSRVGEKSGKSQGILIWIMSGNPGRLFSYMQKADFLMMRSLFVYTSFFHGNNEALCKEEEN